MDNLIIFSNWTTGYYKHLFPLEIDPTVGWKVPLGWTFQSIYVLFLFIVFVVHINLKFFETLAGSRTLLEVVITEHSVDYLAYLNDSHLS